MINFYFRDNKGKILMSGFCREEELALQKLDNAILEIGEADVTKNYYKNNSLKEYPQKPEGFYNFNYETELWEIDIKKTEEDVLLKRDTLLAEGPDRISPMWWASMSEQEQQAWIFYRQALLDITGQADYPEFIVWPIKP